MLLLLLAFGLCSLRKGFFVLFTANRLVLGVSLCQAFDLNALKLLGQKQGFITRLLVA